MSKGSGRRPSKVSDDKVQEAWERIFKTTKKLRKKMAKMSPTQLTLRKLKTDGWTTLAIVEHWNPFARIRQDLFGCIDILALKDGDTLAIQCTTYNNRWARVKKISENDHIANMRKCNWSIEVWGWRKNKSNKWEVDVIDIS
jgi:hypothetical protein